jgi:IstB-like ATP binding protein
MSSTKSTASSVATAREDIFAQHLDGKGVMGSSNPTAESTLALLSRLGLHGMAAGFKDLDERFRTPDVRYTEWLALILEKERDLREKRRFERRSPSAKLGHAASIEDAEKLETHRGKIRPDVALNRAAGFAHSR